MRYLEAVAFLTKVDEDAIEPAGTAVAVGGTDVLLRHDAAFGRIVLSAIVLPGETAVRDADLDRFLCRATLAFHGRGGQVLSREADGTLVCNRSIALDGLTGLRILQEVGAIAERSRGLGEAIRSNRHAQPATPASAGEDIYLRA